MNLRNLYQLPNDGKRQKGLPRQEGGVPGLLRMVRPKAYEFVDLQ